MLRLPKKARVGVLVLLLSITAVVLFFHEGTNIAVNNKLSDAKNYFDSQTRPAGTTVGGDSSDSKSRENAGSAVRSSSFSSSSLSTPLSYPSSSSSSSSSQESAHLPVQSRTHPVGKYDNRLENATMYTLCQNKDLEEMVDAVRSVEEKFNKDYHYDWVFLNNEDFSKEFKDAINAETSGNVYFGKINKEAWGYPDYIDLEKAAQTREWMLENNVIYGDMESYHHMCRYQSGFFFRHPLMMNYKYAWRVEPGIRILCYQKHDPFEMMRKNELIYGFNLALREIPKAIQGLWKSIQTFLHEGDHKKYLDPNNLDEFVTTSILKNYNTCHFWTNFEITDMDWLRSEAYMSLFNYLDRVGGFYYERWGDAPIRSIAVSLFAPADKVHFFNEIGYYHKPFGHCPYNQGPLELKCDCEVKDGEFKDEYFDYTKNSCLRNYFKAKGRTFRDENPKKKSSG